MKTSFTTKSLVTTSILALAAGQVVAMNGGTIIPDADIHTTGAVSIAHTDDVECSGTLLAPTWVLTAQHCMIPLNYNFASGSGEGVAAPDHSSSGANSATWSAGRWILGGWTADEIDNNVKTRRAGLVALTADGSLSSDFGPTGFVGIPIADPGLISSEVNHIIPVPSTSDIIAVGDITTTIGSQMLIARLDQHGQVVGSRWPVSTVGGTILPVPGEATRATIAGSDIVVAGFALTGGLPHWTAIKVDSSGHQVPFTPFFGDSTTGALLDVVTVGNHLVWLGTRDDIGRNSVVVTTDFAGNAESSMIALDTTVMPYASRLRARRDGTSVWLAGTDQLHTAARVVKLAVPGLAPATSGWPTEGAEMTTAPANSAAVSVTDLAEDSLGRVIVVGSWNLKKSTRQSMIARFTAAGAPDDAFGQSGLIVTLDHHPQRARAVSVDGPSDFPLTIFGSQGEGKDQRMLASAYLDDQSHGPFTLVAFGGTPSSVLHTYYEPHPGVDVALIELEDPLADQAGIHIAGIEHDPSALGVATVKCLGYGTNEHEQTGELHAGQFTLTETDTRDASLEGTWPTMIRSGDSGGGCVVNRNGEDYIVGTVSFSFERPAPSAGSDDQVTYAWLVDAHLFADFVEDKIPGYAH